MLINLLAVVAAAGIAAPTEAPKWEADYGKALQQVRADEKPLLVVVDKPGQAIDAALLGEKSADALTKYDLCRVDASTKYGQEVADAFKAKKFPFVAFIDKTGQVVLHSHQGKITKTTWESSLKKYQTGEQPQRHVVLKPATTSYPVEYQTIDSYQSNSYCPSCQKGY